MKRKTRGQALVEFAMVFPMLILLLFAAIDFGYYIYGWSEAQFAARRVAEQGSILPPRRALSATAYKGTYRDTDPCLQYMTDQAERVGAINNATQITFSKINITYHGVTDSNAILNDNSPSATTFSPFRRPGNIIQVHVDLSLTPLTPLASSIFRGRNFEFDAFSRRTIPSTQPPIGATSALFLNCYGTAPTP